MMGKAGKPIIFLHLDLQMLPPTFGVSYKQTFVFEFRCVNVKLSLPFSELNVFSCSVREFQQLIMCLKSFSFNVPHRAKSEILFTHPLSFSLSFAHSLSTTSSIQTDK
jgi:hypothetical protein